LWQSQGNKMKQQNNQQKIGMVLLAVLLAAHLLSLMTAQLGQYNTKRQPATGDVPVFLTEKTTPPQGQLADFSQMFGIEALFSAANSDGGQSEKLTLDKANPALLAVSQSAQGFSAKIAVTEDKKTKLLTVVVGGEVMGFTLKQLNLTQAEFSNGDQQLTLRMFKREESAKKK